MPFSGEGNHQDDEHLKCLLATDPKEHFADLVLAYGSRLTTYACCRLSNRQDAEEAVQDVFERVYYALKGYSVQRILTLHLRVWLYTITKNTCCNFLRKRPKTSSESLETSEENGALSEREADCSEQPELVYERKEHIHEIEQAVAALPEYCREPVRLRLFESLSYQEIADRLDLPIGTVKCYISRGIAMLRKNLGE